MRTAKPRPRRRPITIVALPILALSLALALPAEASTDISIPFDDLVFGAPGSIVLLTEVDVDAELVGDTCRLSVLAENQSSVHKGNDLIVSTGDSQAIIVGVEDAPNAGSNQTYDMVVGPTIKVQLRIGQDGMSSLGFGLSFDCVQPATTTPSATTSTAPANLGEQQLERPVETTAPPATTAAPVTTTTPPTVPATVAGAAVGNLPETPAAKAVGAAPSYTG